MSMACTDLVERDIAIMNSNPKNKTLIKTLIAWYMVFPLLYYVKLRSVSWWNKR